MTRVDVFQRAAPVASGPRAAIAGLEVALAAVDASAREDWLETARLQAILQPCSRSLPGLRSGLRCWQAFCTRVLHHSHIALPPAATELATWSTVFRCKGTFDNYVSYVRVGCLLVGADVRVFDDPIVRRAKAAVRSRGDFVARPKLFIGMSVVARFVERGTCAIAVRPFAMLYLFAYVFLLRVPSEALPAIRITSPVAPSGVQSAIFVGDSEITLFLARRKNRPGGSVLHRRCWCSKEPAACPVHSLGPFFASFAPGAPVFDGIDPGGALVQLRRLAAELGVPDASRLRTHDLRRGHARDLAQSGAPLSEILRAGEWRRRPR